MIRNGFRPWGRMDSVLRGYTNQEWAFLGCLATEDRSIAAYKLLQSIGKVSNALVFHVKDSPSRFDSSINAKIEKLRIEWRNLGLVDDQIVPRDILGPHGEFATDIDRFINGLQATNVLIDISCLPKRFFFLILKKLISGLPNVQNILACYTDAQEYSKERLAENHSSWAPLPGFIAPANEPDEKKLIVSLGYEPLGLPDLYSNGLFNSSDIEFLFPFPASPESISKNWKFLQRLMTIRSGSTNIRRIDPLNVPDVFELLSSLTDKGLTYSTLAPFGPKSISLAMCLFAISCSAKSSAPSVFYTQPTVYHPEYSIGVKAHKGIPFVNTYCLRLHGQNLYGV
jgi:hypothetical protein